MSKCSADETPVCCCMDVGTIMDNSDCTASYSRVFANRAEAEQTLAALTEKARSVESEPCKKNTSNQQTLPLKKHKVNSVRLLLSENVIKLSKNDYLYALGKSCI